MKTVNIDAHFGLERMRLAISGDVNVGEVVRDEGAVNMSLIDTVLSVESDGVDFSAVHGDLLGLIGVLAFYPALPRNEEFDLRFSFPVSSALELALRRPWILEGVRVHGAGNSGPYEPQTDAVISYGGGIDSLAACILFPEVPLVHESPLPTRNAFFSDVVNEIVSKESQSANTVVFDNLRQLFTAWGLPLWVSVYIASLVRQPSSIISGSEMTGTYLLGGERYAPRYANIWYTVFRIVGVSILPTSFLSEIGNARIAADQGRFDEAAYCTRISRKDCNTCTKCLRRRIIRGIFEPEALTLVDEFERSEDITPFLEKRPLYYGDVFTHAVASHERRTWVSDHVDDLVSTHGRLGFHDAYYPDAFDHFKFPAELRSQAEATMHKIGIMPFSSSDYDQFFNYRQISD